MIEKSAIFSPCRKYRFVLERHWKREKGYALFVGLNPSTADENIDDPTIRRCIRFAETWGYGGLVMCNVFAYRATDPKDLFKYQPLMEPRIENLGFIKNYSKNSSITIAAWGNHAKFKNRYREVISLLKDPHHLGLTKSGQPKHPLYLKATIKPQRF